MNHSWFMSQASDLRSLGYEVNVARDYSWVNMAGSELRDDGWTDGNGRPIQNYSVFIQLTRDFPMTVPGVGHTHPTHAIHIPLIRYKGRDLTDLYSCKHSPWHWFCFESIDWDPREDNLITLLQIIETSIYSRRQ